MIEAGSVSVAALVGYALWTLALLLAILIQRAVLVLRGRRADDFTPTHEDLGPFAVRLARAHANCVENLPIFGAIVLAAVAIDRTDVSDPLAPWVLAARIGQSVTHLSSTSPLAVQVRFTFAVVQVGLLAWMGLTLLLR